MHEIQQKLLSLAETTDLGSVSYYALAKLLGVNHHNKVRFHLEQLIRKGLLVRNKNTGSIAKVINGEVFRGFISIPIMGEANCGVPLIFAENTIKGFLRVSPSSLRTNRLEKIYALKAVGDSMNATNIHGRSIESGDYVLVEDTSTVNHGEVVVSIIDGAANIKRLLIDGANHRLILLSESQEPLPPIVIDESDIDSHYQVAGRVIDIIKAIPKLENSAPY